MPARPASAPIISHSLSVVMTQRRRVLSLGGRAMAGSPVPFPARPPDHTRAKRGFNRAGNICRVVLFHMLSICRPGVSPASEGVSRTHPDVTCRNGIDFRMPAIGSWKPLATSTNLL